MALRSTCNSFSVSHKAPQVLRGFLSAEFSLAGERKLSGQEVDPSKSDDGLLVRIVFLILRRILRSLLLWLVPNRLQNSSQTCPWGVRQVLHIRSETTAAEASAQTGLPRPNQEASEIG